MARGELLKKLFVNYNRGSGDEFRAAALEIIADEERKRNLKLAKNLKKALMAGSTQPVPNVIQPAFNEVPLEDDKHSPLVELIEPQKRASDIILSYDNTKLFSGIIEEFRRARLIRSHGLTIRSKLLFCGPPGCGKTLCAEVFAHEVKLPLLFTRFDALVSSYLGETASNLRKVFDYAEKRPVVLFFDEVDAIAKARDDISEHGELKRVVNSFLQLIDHFQSDGFIIAATNHEGMLDPAIWRRFDEVVLFAKPTRNEISKLLAAKFRNFTAHIDFQEWADRFEKFSHAEIERVCINAIKQSLLKEKMAVDEYEFQAAFETEQHRRAVIERLHISNSSL